MAGRYPSVPAPGHSRLRCDETYRSPYENTERGQASRDAKPGLPPLPLVEDFARARNDPELLVGNHGSPAINRAGGRATFGTFVPPIAGTVARSCRARLRPAWTYRVGARGQSADTCRYRSTRSLQGTKPPSRLDGIPRGFTCRLARSKPPARGWIGLYPLHRTHAARARQLHAINQLSGRV